MHSCGGVIEPDCAAGTPANDAKVKAMMTTNVFMSVAAFFRSAAKANLQS